MKLLMIGAAALTLISGTVKAGPTLDAVKQRGQLICGVHTGLAGFGAPDARGNWTGLDVDMCRAVAAAVLGDATKVKFVPLSTQQRLAALQAGEIDMLARNTTRTLQRETASGLDFPAVNYYDGQGFMVPANLGVTHAKDLNGATVCVLPGTTTEQNVSDYFRANDIEYRPVVIEKNEELVSAYLSGRCDAITSDASQLAAIRANQTPNPAEHTILPELISKEPLAVGVRHGDDQWADIVGWTVFALIEAEERGIGAQNVDQHLSSPDPTVQRLLGVSGDMGQALGLDNKWAYNAIKAVGNYGESFERNVGKGSKLKLERGLNALWSKGGLMYAPPIR